MKEPTLAQRFEFALSSYAAAVIRTEQAQVAGDGANHARYYHDELTKRSVVVSIFKERED
jgi:hypothetical protein